MLLILTALLWALPSFLLHNVLHEGSHALAAWWAGCTNIRLYPFPSRKLGYFTWAHMTYTQKGNFARLRWVPIAPIMGEALWLTPVLPLLFFTPVGWWSGLLLVESISSIVDSTVWMLGFWNPSPNPYSDAETFRSDFGFTRLTGKLYSLLLLLPATLVAWGIVRLFLP